MEIHNIKDVSDDILNSFNKVMNSDCQAGKYSLVEVRDMAKNTDILYLFEGTVPVYFLLLDLFVKHKNVYIHDVCVNKSHRGKGLFKESLKFLKKYYLKKGYTNFTLDASNSTKEEGLNQKIRIHIFHSAGFDINTETGYYTKSGDYNIIKTIVLLDNKEKVEIQKRNGDTYYVKNDRGEQYKINIDQIEQCFDSESNPLSCPMIMNMKMKTDGGRRRRTRRNKKA
jgi:GNAT superfamily N-acetyltransferase